jgi:hypothetical protein
MRPYTTLRPLVVVLASALTLAAWPGSARAQGTEERPAARESGQAAPEAGGAAPPAAQAQAADQTEALAKQLSNPVSSLISVPFQNNFYYGLGRRSTGSQWLLNVQPVIPFSMTSKWNVISRTIMPLVYQSEVFTGAGTQFGLGDFNPSQFFSPKAPTKGGLIWGVGPVELLPTATNKLLGGGKWGLGPTAVLVMQKGPNTIGLLANQIWSIGGVSNRPDISATYLQPFYAKTYKGGFTAGMSSESTYNWKNSQWTIPFLLNASQIFRLPPRQLAQIGFSFKYYVERPSPAPQWGIRVTLTLLFPKIPKR